MVIYVSYRLGYVEFRTKKKPLNLFVRLSIFIDHPIFFMILILENPSESAPVHLFSCYSICILLNCE
jgi:hypothetical protein